MAKNSIDPAATGMPDFAIPGEPDSSSPQPGVLLAGAFSQPFGYHVRRPGGTRDWLFLFTRGGLGRIRFNETIHPQRRGDVWIYAPGAMQDYATASPDLSWDFDWAHTIPRPHWIPWLRPLAFGANTFRCRVRSEETQSALEAACVRMLAESQRKGPFQEELAQNALEEALLLLLRERSAGQSRYQDDRVNRIQHYLEQHYMQSVSLDDLARLASLSPWRLSHLFKEQTGQSIKETVIRMRLQQAARLLALTSRQVNEIAGDVGFESPFHFSRAFKALYGLSPLEYRRARAQGNAETGEGTNPPAAATA